MLASNLKRTTTEKKLGVNEDVNSEIPKAKWIQHMDGGKPKIHRLVLPKAKAKVQTKFEPSPDPKSQKTAKLPEGIKHEEIKIGTFVIVGTLAFALAWYAS